MNKIILYHGLAKEWAVCRPDDTNGWVHKYELDCDEPKILDFQKMETFQSVSGGGL